MADAAQEYVAREELRPSWLAVHARISAGGTARSVRVQLADPAQARALANLLGLAVQPDLGPIRVQLADLDAVLAGAGLPSAVELVSELIGPVVDRRAQRAELAAQRLDLWSWLAEQPVVRRLELHEWVTAARAAGLQGTVAETRALYTAALAVLAELPARGEPLATLAGRVLGDPHALDDGRRVARLVLRAAAVMTGAPPPGHAAARRALWDQVGVRSDELSSTVLLAGRWGDDHPGVIGELLGVAQRLQQAVTINLAMLRGATPPAPPGGTVYVVENPSVMAGAVGELGAHCAPLVCISGWPSVAALQLLTMLRDTGTVLRYHGDLDADGLRIADYLIGVVGAKPWRLSVADYTQALAAGLEHAEVDRSRLPRTLWDDQLLAAVRAAGQVVYEEQVIDELIADLAAGGALDRGHG